MKHCQYFDSAQLDGVENSVRALDDLTNLAYANFGTIWPDSREKCDPFRAGQQRIHRLAPSWAIARSDHRTFSGPIRTSGVLRRPACLHPVPGWRCSSRSPFVHRRLARGLPGSCPQAVNRSVLWQQLYVGRHARIVAAIGAPYSLRSRSICPAPTPVWLPPSYATRPFTTTISMPTGSCFGLS